VEEGLPSAWSSRALAAGLAVLVLLASALAPGWAWILCLGGLGWLALRPALRPAWRDPSLVTGLSLSLSLATLAGLAYWQCSADFGGRRWWWLEDDALVSMRYALRLVQGRGLTWTDGPRVEGYSNFLWTLGMALVHALGAGQATASAWVLLACGACLAWLGFATRSLAKAFGASDLEAALAGAAMVLSYDQLATALTGMEGVAVAALSTQALAWVARSRKEPGPPPWPALALASLLPLLRADGALPALLLWWLAWPRLDGWPRKLAGLALALAPGLAHLAWRHAYYGAWVPNTYTLKAGWWPGKWQAGAGKAALDLARYPLILLAAPLALRRRELRPFGLALLALLAYTVWSGADYFPSLRFFAPGCGLLTALAFAALASPPVPGRLRVGLAWALLLAGFNLGLALPTLARAGWSFARERVQVGLELRGTVAPGEKLASAWAGAFFYYSGAQGVDLLGKCDPVVAASEPSLGLEGVGHNKMDLDWSLGVLRPRWVLMELTPYSEPEHAYVVAQYDLRLLEHPLFRRYCLPRARQLTDHWALCDCDWSGLPAADANPSKKGKS
jgi:hypothetical protein